MKPLIREAVLISRELDGAVFVGAVAQYAHTKIFRESEDVDVALRRPLSEEYLSGKKYSKHDENGKEVWRTPALSTIGIWQHVLCGDPRRTVP